MKKLTTLLIICCMALMLTFGLTACGDKTCDHIYDNACDAICNECGEERTITHDWNAADCDTPKTCKVCGATEGEKLGHDWTTPDVDLCEVQSTCSRCGATDGENVEHDWTAADCESARSCSVCGATDGEKLGHTPNADDGDCTTAVTCKHCTTVLTEAKSAHEASEDDGDCTTDIICKHCEQVTVAGNANHTPNADDNNCETPVVCSVCGKTTTEAREHDFTGEWQKVAQGHYHICKNDGCTVEDTKVGHTGGEATCLVGKLCGDCGYEYDTNTNSDNHASDVYNYKDNGDGTHTKTHECGVIVGEPENHTIENHVCTACGAMEIVVSFDAGDYEWKTGDELYFCRISRDNQWEKYCFTATVAEDGTVTWTPDKPLYWYGTGEHGLIVSYPANMGLGWDDFVIPGDQSTPELLRDADHMNARWVGTPTTNVIEFELNHRMAKITVNYTIASQLDPDAPVIAEIYSNAMYCIFRDADGLPIITSVGRYDAWIIPYHNDNQFTAYVAPGEYNTDGMFKFYIGDVEVQIKIANPGAVTLEEGGEYTFDVKVGQDVLTIVEVSMGDIDSPFGDGWHNEIELRAIGTQDVGKTAWEEGDRIIVTFTSPSFGTQFGILTYEAAVWSTDVSFSYLEDETPTVSAIYAPCYEVVDGNMQLKDGLQLGMTEYISADCSFANGEFNISFGGQTAITVVCIL